MKPENSLDSNSFEKLSVKYEPSAEALPKIDEQESKDGTGSELHQRQAEASSIVAELKLTTALPTPVPSTDPVQDATSIGLGPTVASDDDLIEKEWVDKAKKIVTETQNDPYQRESKVSQLQVDYIKKRFGRELGVAE